jgi:aldose 1-epimerase
MILSREFGRLPSGEVVEAFELRAASGASVSVLTYGGIVQSVRVPDRAGQIADVVLGFSGLDSYLERHPYFGCITGRVAGRITGGMLRVAGRDCQLALNDPPNHLHGGIHGLDRRLWRATAEDERLVLRYHSPDGEEGYPGAVDFTVAYRWTDGHEFIIESEATSDCPTPVSLANHSYFNLAGEGSGPVDGHVVQILADEFVPADEKMTLSGRRESLDGRPNDLRAPRVLGEVLPHLHLRHGDNYLLPPTPGVRMVARVTEPTSGRTLEVRTDESNLQFYTGSHLDGAFTGKCGRPYVKHDALCLECQGYPDGAMYPELGEIVVRPGHPQRRTTVYAFSVV